MVECKVYTIADLREWLDGVDNGISDHLISQQRAIAFVHNPDAQSDDPALAVAYSDGRAVGYTAAFAERMADGERWYWGTTLYVDPAQRGKGIGKQVMLAIKEATRNLYLALDSSDSSIAIDQKQGWEIIYYNRYYMRFVASHTFKGRIKQWLMDRANQKVQDRLDHSIQAVSYHHFSYIDASTYTFMQKHSGKDMFFRSRAMFNWMLQYPFQSQCPTNWIEDHFDFVSYSDKYYLYGLRICVQNELVAVAIIRCDKGIFTILYWYCNRQQTDAAHQAMWLHLLQAKCRVIRTFEKSLSDYATRLGICEVNKKRYAEHVAFTKYPSFECNIDLHIQGGDGDMFA